MCIHHGTSLLKHSCWLSTTSHICLRIDFSLLQPNPHQSFPRHLPEPIRSNTPSLLSHTDLSAPRLFHTTSCLFFTFTHNISSLQSIRLSRSSSNVPSSVEPSPTFSGPVDRSLLCAPTVCCPHLHERARLVSMCDSCGDLGVGNTPCSSENSQCLLHDVYFADTQSIQVFSADTNNVWPWTSL